MRSKKIVLLVSLITMFLLFYFNRPDRRPFDVYEFSLPECELEYAPITTNVFFFVDQSLKKSFSKLRASKFVEYANGVLLNSCISLHRELISFEYVNFDLSDEEFLDEIHSQVVKSIGRQRILNIRENSTDFYVVVLPDDNPYFYDDTIGVTDWELSESFILLSDKASIDTLEHEFGHLMWANHVEKNWFNPLQRELEMSLNHNDRHLVKPYARGYLCSNAGTIMSYEKLVLPVYSNPDVYYRGVACGDVERGNNKRRVEEYVKKLRQKLKNSGMN